MPEPRRLMNEEQLKTWVLRRLGAPRVRVELHPCHLDDAFEDAMDWYIAYKGVQREALMALTAGQVSYPPPPDADSVLDVILPAPPFDLSIVFSPYILADEKIPYDVFAAPEAAGIYSSLAQAIQYTEIAKRVLSAEFNWMWNEAARKIIISPIPRHSGTAIVQYKSNCVTVDQLSAFDHRLFKRYMLALAKETLGGRIWGKYGGSFPAAGGDRTLDAQTLLQEGREEQEKLTEELYRSSYPMPFITG